MATKRMLSRRVTESDKMIALKGDNLARFVYTALLAHTDRTGCINANPYGLKGTVFEGFEFTVEDIAKALQALSKVGLVTLYRSGRHQLIARYEKFEDFNKPHKNEAASDFPLLGEKGTEKVTDVASATGLNLCSDNVAEVTGHCQPAQVDNVAVKGKELRGGKNSTEFSTGGDAAPEKAGAAPKGASPPRTQKEFLQRKLDESSRNYQASCADAQAYEQANGLPPWNDPSKSEQYRHHLRRERAKAWREQARVQA